jgi:DNA (cytosine-5)-methyltransferase 1
MIRNQFILDLHGEMIVDNFAGGGGASTGIERALGRCVDIAINHDAEAIAMHEANHPQTKHYCEDVWKVDPLEATQGRPVGLAWFSPDCKHFSKAKGGKPKSKKIRGLAWVMVRWAKLVRPRVMMLENVEEFQTWGPLLTDGSACPKRKGETFRRFVVQLVRLGYKVEWRELRACDHGTPTIRKRLFLIARCDGKPIVWPEPTHADPRRGKMKSDAGRRLKPWRTAAECIDWSLPCPSIFERDRPLAEATMRRIARGIRKFVIEAAEPFIVKYHAAKRDGDDRVGSIFDPLPTQTSENRFGLATPVLVNVANSKTTGRGPNAWMMGQPLRTITSAPSFAVAEATLAPFLTEHANASGQRVFDPQEPLRTQCGEVKGGHFAQVSAFLAKHYGGNETPGSSLARPVDTVTATDHNALVVANLMVNTTGHSGGAANGPMPTIATGGHQAAVVSHISKLYGTNTGHDPREPLHTVTGGGKHLAEVRAFLIKYYGEGGQEQDVADPLHTVTAKHRMGLVTIHGEDYVITDIGMRMLEPHELYRAQGFPADYIIAPLTTVVRHGKKIERPLPKYAQVRMCGNSVCPPLSEAIVAANVPELSAWGAGERRQKEVA